LDTVLGSARNEVIAPLEANKKLLWMEEGLHNTKKVDAILANMGAA